MRTFHRVAYIAIVFPVLLGCALLGGRPTPLPLATASPEATAASEGLPTVTSTTAPTATQSPSDTPTVAPTPTETPAELPASPTPQLPAQSIALELPQAGARVGNPVTVRGRAALTPFEKTLVVRIYDGRGQLAALVPIMTQGEYGGPATFEASLAYGGVPGAGRIEVVEFSARDGSVSASASAAVTLEGYPGSGYVESPAPLARITLPVGLLAHVGTPGEQVNVTVAWEDGTQFATVLPTLRGIDGRGLVVSALDWALSTQPPAPSTQMGVIQIHTLSGSPLAIQPVTILHPQDPDTMSTKVYWVLGEELQPETIRIPKTQGIGRASLEMLLWGPAPSNLAGFTSALPSPAEVLDYPGRTSSWGERVRLRDLTIINGVARADFSEELAAHSGGSLRIGLIRQQIEETLLQFSTVKEVIITVNGSTAALEP